MGRAELKSTFMACDRCHGVSPGCPGGTTDISRWQAERSHRTATTMPTSPGGAAERNYNRLRLGSLASPCGYKSF